MLKLSVSFYINCSQGYRKNRPDSLINQRLPGINGAKIGIISEYPKYLSNDFSKIDYKHIILLHALPTWSSPNINEAPSIPIQLKSRIMRAYWFRA